MILPLPQLSRRYVIIDIDMQREFLLAGGDSCVRTQRRLLAHIRRIMAWARHTNIPIISTAKVHRDKGHATIGHCIDGPERRTKIAYTLVSNRISFPADGMNYLPAGLLQAHKQIILHKRCIDPFDEPRLDRLLSEVQADEFILIGVSTEGAVKATALGLLQRGKNVRVVADAIGSHNQGEAELALRKMQIRGARLTATENLVGVSHLREVDGCFRRQGR